MFCGQAPERLMQYIEFEHSEHSEISLQCHNKPFKSPPDEGISLFLSITFLSITSFPTTLSFTLCLFYLGQDWYKAERYPQSNTMSFDTYYPMLTIVSESDSS